MFYNPGLWQSAAINVIRSGQMAFRSKHTSRALKDPRFVPIIARGHAKPHGQIYFENGFKFRSAAVLCVHRSDVLGNWQGFEWQTRHILIISVVLKFPIICESIDAPWWFVAFENSSPWSWLADYKSKLYNNASEHPIMCGISTGKAELCQTFQWAFCTFSVFVCVRDGRTGESGHEPECESLIFSTNKPTSARAWYTYIMHTDSE